MIDYILIRRNDISKVKDCKVIPGESIATQPRILTMDIGIQTKNRVKPRRRKQQIKWWRLKDRDENRIVALRRGGLIGRRYDRIGSDGSVALNHDRTNRSSWFIQVNSHAGDSVFAIVFFSVFRE